MPCVVLLLYVAPMCRYFGAAKQLPGVKELFEKEAPKQVGTIGVGISPSSGCRLLVQHQLAPQLSMQSATRH